MGFIWALDGLTNGLNSFDHLYKGFYEVLRGFLGPPAMPLQVGFWALLRKLKRRGTQIALGEPEHALKHPEL